MPHYQLESPAPTGHGDEPLHGHGSAGPWITSADASIALRDPAGHVTPEDLTATVPVSRYDVRTMRHHVGRAIDSLGSVALARDQAAQILTALSATVAKMGAPEPLQLRQLRAELGSIDRATARATMALGDAERILTEIWGAE